jgi:regulator of replication initiation timing
MANGEHPYYTTMLPQPCRCHCRGPFEGPITYRQLDELHKRVDRSEAELKSTRACLGDALETIGKLSVERDELQRKLKLKPIPDDLAALPRRDLKFLINSLRFTFDRVEQLTSERDKLQDELAAAYDACEQYEREICITSGFDPE